MSLADVFGIGLALTLIGGLAVAFEYSPMARTRFARRWIYDDAPGRTHSRRRRASLWLSWGALFLGHFLLVVGAVSWLGQMPE